MSTGQLLPIGLLREIHDAVISARLDRNSLTSSLDHHFVGGLHKAPSPSEQLWKDLNTLNEITALADGSVPLRTWLESALHLSRVLRESAVFRRALEVLAAALTAPAVAQTREPAPPAREPTPIAARAPNEAPPAADPRRSAVLLHAAKDEAFRERFETHLRMLKDEVRFWDLSKVPAGTERARAIAGQIDGADMIVLLLSADFLASEDWAVFEERVRAAHRRGAHLFPIRVRPCLWPASKFKDLQLLPRIGKEIGQADNDEGWVDVLQEIRAVLDDHAWPSPPPQARPADPPPTRPVDPPQERPAAPTHFVSQPGTPLADVVLITALSEEYAAARKVDTGADGPWTEDKSLTGFEVAFRTYRTIAGHPLRVALTWAPRMRTTATADTAASLADKLHPRCLTMTGVCAGRRGKVEPGDVILASVLYTYDTGALRIEYDETGAKHERFQADPNHYPLDDPWLHRAQAFEQRARTLDPADAPWLAPRPPTLAAQSDWVLWCLHTGESLRTHPDAPVRCPSWIPVLARLRSLTFVTPTGALRLTDKGTAHIEEVLLQHRGALPMAPPFRLHVAPIATGNNVMRDPRLFERLSDAMRPVLGVEMEAAAIAAVAHARGLRWLVMKGVMDHADHDKDDELKPFAARASAECLLAFLRENPPDPPEARRS